MMTGGSQGLRFLRKLTPCDHLAIIFCVWGFGLCVAGLCRTGVFFSLGVGELLQSWSGEGDAHGMGRRGVGAVWTNLKWGDSKVVVRQSMQIAGES